MMPIVTDDLAARLLEDFDETEHLDIRPTLTGAQLIAIVENATEAHPAAREDGASANGNGTPPPTVANPSSYA